MPTFVFENVFYSVVDFFFASLAVELARPKWPTWGLWA